MKKRYVLAALAAMTVFAGCGDNASQQIRMKMEKNWILNFPRM